MTRRSNSARRSASVAQGMRQSIDSLDEAERALATRYSSAPPRPDSEPAVSRERPLDASARDPSTPAAPLSDAVSSHAVSASTTRSTLRTRAVDPPPKPIRRTPGRRESRELTLAELRTRRRYWSWFVVATILGSAAFTAAAVTQHRNTMLERRTSFTQPAPLSATELQQLHARGLHPSGAKTAIPTKPVHVPSQPSTVLTAASRNDDNAAPVDDNAALQEVNAAAPHENAALRDNEAAQRARPPEAAQPAEGASRAASEELAAAADEVSKAAQSRHVAASRTKRSPASGTEAPSRDPSAEAAWALARERAAARERARAAGASKGADHPPQVEPPTDEPPAEGPSKPKAPPADPPGEVPRAAFPPLE